VAKSSGKWARSACAKLPLLWDFYAYFWGFRRKAPICRGVFESFRAAAAACPKGKRIGYSQELIAGHSDPARLTAMQEVGRFDSRDYPLLVWLTRAFDDSTTLFDLGGNVGLGFYAYRSYIRYPENLRWVVCDIPELCRAGEQVALERKVECLAFTHDFKMAQGMDILLTCGTLQYLETSLAALLLGLTSKPRHILIQRVPMCDGPSFHTLQNIGYAVCPYRIQNKQEFFDSLERLGYRSIDSWKDSRECRIPFHPRRTVQGYLGAYLKLEHP
jgi:putative methyltransferase (TIGR04325 family)